MKKETKKRSGFTLVELIVVIAIIAILAALAVPRVEKFVDDARAARVEADFASVNTAVSAGYTSWVAKNANVKLPVTTGTTPTGVAQSIGAITTSSSDDLQELQKEITSYLPAGITLSTAANQAGITETDATTDASGEYWYIELTGDSDGKLETTVIINNDFTSTNRSKPQ